MLYFYQSISPHKIERLHNYLHHFFTKMFAEVYPIYDHSHCIDSNFRVIVTTYKTQLDDKLKHIYTAYMKLKPQAKSIVQAAYANNNDIENICNGSAKPFKYPELPKGIRKPVKILYDELWDSILGYARVEDKCGTLKQHFNLFRKKNKNSVCPFCGIDGLLNEYDDLKNAYDHYIPQKKYPFCSIQFRNLAPICDQCNKSGNKGQKDIPYVPKTSKQRVLYFPYSSIYNHKIELSINASTTELKNSAKWVLSIDCVPATNTSKKDAWLEIFNLEKRYKAMIAKESYKWKDKVILDYTKQSKRTGFNLSNFISDKISDFSDIENQKDAIVKKCFHEFYLNHSNFKKSIKGIV